MILLFLSCVSCFESGPEPSGWSQVGGQGVNFSWNDDRHNLVRGMSSFKGKLYAGLGGLEAEIWEYDNEKWTLIGGDSVNDSWPKSRAVHANVMVEFNGEFYAGLGTTHKQSGAEVWKYDGLAWSQVGQNLGDPYEMVWSMTVHNEEIYIGIQTEDFKGYGHIFKLNKNNQWVRVEEPFSHLYFGTYDMQSFQSDLYVGTWGRDADSGAVWRLSSGEWEQVGGLGINEGWSDPNIHFIEDLMIFDERLLIAHQRVNPSTQSSVWAWDGEVWSEVGSNIPALWSESTIFNYLIEFSGSLFLGTGGNAGVSAVWNLQNNEWIQVGGSGINNSWTFLEGSQRGPQEGPEWIYRFVELDGFLHSGHAGHKGSAQVWRFNPN